VAGSAWTNQIVDLIVVSAASSGFSGFFVYSPSPAAGNLLVSIAAQTGKDPYGNTYLSNITGYENDAGTWLATQIGGGGIFFWSAPSSSSNYTLYGQMSGTTVGVLGLAFGGGNGSIAQSSAGITTVAQLVTVLKAAGILF
jgi:hypothetical protein